MFGSNRVKIFFLFAATLCQACSFWQSNSNATPAPTTFENEESKSEIPFSTKEPSVYQAEIVLTNYNKGEKTERKTFVARNGEKLRGDYESKISLLQTSASEKFLIHAVKKIYTESQANSNVSLQGGGDLQDFLTNELLNEKADARFENLGSENGLTKYRVRLADSAASETLIYVDENFKLPVRQEFYSINGEQRNLIFSMEIRNFKLQADANLFQLPKDYKKVSSEEFQKIIWQEKFDAEK